MFLQGFIDKQGLYIGLTVKCLDYLGNGLPIINNIAYDTSELVDRYHIGFNVKKDKNIKGSDIIDMAENNKHILTKTFFRPYFIAIFITNIIQAYQHYMYSLKSLNAILGIKMVILII